MKRRFFVKAKLIADDQLHYYNRFDKELDNKGLIRRIINGKIKGKYHYALLCVKVDDKADTVLMAWVPGLDVMDAKGWHNYQRLKQRSHLFIQLIYPQGDKRNYRAFWLSQKDLLSVDTFIKKKLEQQAFSYALLVNNAKKGHQRILRVFTKDNELTREAFLAVPSKTYAHHCAILSTADGFRYVYEQAYHLFPTKTLIWRIDHWKMAFAFAHVKSVFDDKTKWYWDASGQKRPSGKDWNTLSYVKVVFADRTIRHYPDRNGMQALWEKHIQKEALYCEWYTRDQLQQAWYQKKAYTAAAWIFQQNKLVKYRFRLKLKGLQRMVSLHQMLGEYPAAFEQRILNKYKDLILLAEFKNLHTGKVEYIYRSGIKYLPDQYREAIAIAEYKASIRFTKRMILERTNNDLPVLAMCSSLEHAPSDAIVDVKANLEQSPFRDQIEEVTIYRTSDNQVIGYLDQDLNIFNYQNKVA